MRVIGATTEVNTTQRCGGWLFPVDGLLLIADRYLRTGQAKSQLQAAGHDVVWSGDWDRDPWG
jgi:hypothetical protein